MEVEKALLAALSFVFFGFAVHFENNNKKMNFEKKKEKEKKSNQFSVGGRGKKKKRSDDQLLAEPVSELVPAAVPELLGQLRDVDSGGLGERRGPDADAVPGPAA